MPGIAGILARTPSPELEDRARRMIDALGRVPGSPSGTMFMPSSGLYVGWVAHPGSYAARQSGPLGGASGGLALAGEVMGVDLRSRLAATGDDAPAAVASLNGLFAGLWVDPASGEAWLFNDRYGSERIYIHRTEDGTLHFASEAKALLRALPDLRAFDDAGLAQYLAFGSTLEGRSLYRGIELLPGGSIVRARAGQPPRETRYFRPAQWEALQEIDNAEFEARLVERFPEILGRYLNAEQPVGLSLTGGLDTRMILACLRNGRRPDVAYTYSVEGNDRLLDLRIARRLAGMRGIPHEAVRLGPSFLAEFAQELDRTVYLTDGCAGALGTHEVYLSARARALAPIRLTGNYGSEVFRGASTFKRVGPPDTSLNPDWATRVQAAVANANAHATHPVTQAAFREVPYHLFGNLASVRSHLVLRTPFLDNELVELAYRAPPAARKSAASALALIHHHDPELAQVPTDRGVVWRPSPLTGKLRRFGSEVMFKFDYWYSEGLPDRFRFLAPLLQGMEGAGWLGVHKFLRYRRWFANELAEYAGQAVRGLGPDLQRLWKEEELARIVPEHRSGRVNRLADLHALLTLGAVERTLLRGGT